MRDWALLLGGTSVGVVLLATAWLGISLKRRREHLRALKEDTRVRRANEKDAWKESAKRLVTPSADELEDMSGGEEPPEEGGMRDPREPGPKDGPGGGAA